MSEELGNPPGDTQTFGALGLIAEQRGDPRRALEWVIRSVASIEDFPNPITDRSAGRLRILTAELGVSMLESSWQKVTGAALPQAVRAYVSSEMPTPVSDREGDDD